MFYDGGLRVHLHLFDFIEGILEIFGDIKLI